MNSISMSAGTRASLLALSQMQDRATELQRHLSTGKRVNDPTDDAAAYFLAAGLTGRATAINALMSGITNAQSALTSANKGISSIQSLLGSAQSLANQALAASQSLVTVTGTNSTALTTSSVIATAGGSSTRLKAGDTITVNDGTTTATYTAANNDTVQTFLSAVNNTSGLKITASLNSSGQIQLAATSNVNVVIGGTINGAGGGTLTGITGLAAGTTSYVTNTLRSNLATQFDALRSQIDAAAQDAGFNGVNFLTGSSSIVAFNESGSSKLTIAGSQVTSTALGLSASTNSFQLDTDINAALTNITKALTSLQSSSAVLGSMSTVLTARSDFNKGLIDVLNLGADSLTAADTNADSAELLAIQSRQQVAASSFSLTRGNETSALRILGY